MNKFVMVNVTVALPRFLLDHLEAMAPIFGTTVDAQIKEALQAQSKARLRVLEAEAARRAAAARPARRG